MRFIDYFTLVWGSISILALLVPLAERYKLLDRLRGRRLPLSRAALIRLVAVVVLANVAFFGSRALFSGFAHADEVRAMIGRGEYQKAEILLLAGDPDRTAAEWRQLKAAVDCGHSRTGACMETLKALAASGDLDSDDSEVVDAFSHLLDERVTVADLVLIAKEVGSTERLIVLKDRAGAATGVGRQNALAVLAALGDDDSVDRAAAYADEFAKARSCKQIKAVAARVAQGRDKEALPALRHLRKRVKDSFFKDLCAGEDVERAIKAVEAL